MLIFFPLYFLLPFLYLLARRGLVMGFTAETASDSFLSGFIFYVLKHHRADIANGVS